MTAPSAISASKLSDTAICCNASGASSAPGTLTIVTSPAATPSLVSSAVQLDTGIPVANGILTTENDDQATARMAQKGADCAAVAVEMANLLRELERK